MSINDKVVTPAGDRSSISQGSEHGDAFYGARAATWGPDAKKNLVLPAGDKSVSAQSPTTLAISDTRNNYLQSRPAGAFERRVGAIAAMIASAGDTSIPRMPLPNLLSNDSQSLATRWAYQQA